MAKRRRQNPTQSELQRLQEKFTEAVKQRAPEGVLEVYREWEASGEDIAQSVVAQALSALAQDDADDKKAGAYFEQAKEVFERAHAHMKGKQGESLYTLMVRLASHAGAPLAAMEYLSRMRQPPFIIKPKLRTFIPILEACVRGGLSDEAEELWEDLFKSCGPLEDEATAICSTDAEDQWQHVFTLRLRALLGDESKSVGERRDRLNTILADLKATCPQMHLQSGLDEALRKVFQSIGWETSEFGDEKLGPKGCCPVTSTFLQALNCDEADLRSLVARIEQLAIEEATGVALQEWNEFKELLRHPDNEWDTIIDGANVGHHNQNYKGGFFRHSQINEVLSTCGKDYGRRRTVVVLRYHWLRPETNLFLPTHSPKKRRKPQIAQRVGDCGLSGVGAVPEVDPSLRRSVSPSAEPEEESAPTAAVPRDVDVAEGLSEPQQRVAELARRWREQGQLCISPHTINDDLVFLYIAVVMCLRGVSDVQLVTNDEFRDHFWRMRQPLVFKAWCERHTTRYHIQSERAEPTGAAVHDSGAPPAEPVICNVQLLPPHPYSRVAQVRADGGCWHFPMRTRKEKPPDEASPEPKDQREAASWVWLVAWDPGAAKASSS